MGEVGVEPTLFLMWEIYSLLPSPLGILTQKSVGGLSTSQSVQWRTIGMTRLELATSRSQSERSSQTELHSVTAHRQGFEPQRIVLETIMLPITSSMHMVLHFHIFLFYLIVNLVSKCYSLQDLSSHSKACSDLQSCRLDRNIFQPEH